MLNNESEKPIEESEVKESSLSEQKTEKKYQKALFWLLSIGNNTAQLLVLNFVQYFAAWITSSKIVLGFVSAIRSFTGSIFQGVIGRLSDKFGRKLFLLIGFTLSFILTTLFIFTNNRGMLLAVTTIQAVSLSVIGPVWNAAMGDITDLKGRTTFIGKLTAIGQFVGVGLLFLLTGFFYFMEKYSENTLNEGMMYKIIFGISAGNFLLCVFGTIFFKETTNLVTQYKQPRVLVALKNKAFRNFIIVNIFFGISLALLWPIFPFVVVNIMNLEMYQLLILAIIYTLSGSFFGFVGGKIADKIGRKPVLIFSRIIMFSVSLFYIPAIFTHSWIYLILSNLVSGIGNGIFFVLINTYSLDLSTEETYGSYSGLTQVTWGMATFFSSLIAGFIAESISNNYGDTTMIISTTIAIAIMRALATIGYFFIKESLPKGKKIEEDKIQN